MTKAKDKLSKQCVKCDESYLTSNSKQKYCNRSIVKPCLICQKQFSTKCCELEKETCSKKCCGAYIRQKRKIESLTCEGCKEVFIGDKSLNKYCGEVKLSNCKGCEKTIEVYCEQKSKNYCSTSCRNKTMRKTNYTLSKKNCEYCGKEYTPNNSKQRYCGDDYICCKYCGKNFKIEKYLNSMNTTQTYCDNTCSTLDTTNSKLSKDRIQEYKNIDFWAVEFKKENGRKPTITDARLYFNITLLPKNIDQTLFNLRKGGGFERVVKQELLKLGYTPKERTRPIKTENGRKLEIDLYRY